MAGIGEKSWFQCDHCSLKRGLGLPLVAGDLDAMKNTLRTLARADGLGGCDFRQVAAHVVEDLEVEVKIIHVIL